MARAARMVDVERDGAARLQRALFHRAEMDEKVAGILLRIGDAEAHAVGNHHAGIAHLSAGFAIERRLVEHDRTGFAGLERIDFLAVAHQRGDHAFRAISVS